MFYIKFDYHLIIMGAGVYKQGFEVIVAGLGLIIISELGFLAISQNYKA